MKRISVLLISLFAAALFCGSAYAYDVTLNDIELDYENGFIAVSGNIGAMNSGSYVSVEFTDSDGKTVYIDQATSTSRGAFNINVKMTSEYRSGEYTVSVRGTKTDVPAVKTFMFDSSKDNFYVENVTVKKNEEAVTEVYDNESLKVDFDYFSSFSYDMGQVNCRWQLAGAPDGEYFDICESEKTSYDISLKDIERVYNAHSASFKDKKLYLRAAIKVKTVNSQDYSAEVVSKNVVEITTVPYADNVKITGNAKVGGTLKGSYNYYDFQGKAEKNSEYEWLKSSSQNGNYVTAGKGITYIPSSSDEGCYLMLKVTPATADGKIMGEPVMSDSVHINKTTTSGGGGSGNGGGTSVGRPVTPVATPAPTQEPDKEDNKPDDGDVSKGFTDISADYWGKNEIEKAVERKIVSGSGDGKFNPEAPVTRAEFSKMILATIGKSGEEYNNEFADVSADAWYAEFVSACVKLGIVSADTNFRPNDVIKREEMSKMLILAYRTVKDSDDFTESEASFTDNDDISDWAKDFAAECAYREFITGMPDGRFAPAENATRAQATVVANRLYDSLN